MSGGLWKMPDSVNSEKRGMSISSGAGGVSFVYFLSFSVIYIFFGLGVALALFIPVHLFFGLRAYGLLKGFHKTHYERVLRPDRSWYRRKDEFECWMCGILGPIGLSFVDNRLLQYSQLKSFSWLRKGRPKRCFRMPNELKHSRPRPAARIDPPV